MRNHLNLWFMKIIAHLALSVMAMESEAEALGQLATDDLEGKVKLDATKFNSVVVATSAYDYLFVHSLHCWRLHLSMMILHK